MEILISLEKIEDFIRKNRFVLIYFSSDSCSACDSVFPLLKSKLKKYPDVAAGKADVEKVPSVAGAFGVFTIPTVIMFFEDKEILRQGRFINFPELEEKIDRYSEF